MEILRLMMFSADHVVNITVLLIAGNYLTSINIGSHCVYLGMVKNAPCNGLVPFLTKSSNSPIIAFNQMNPIDIWLKIPKISIQKMHFKISFADVGHFVQGWRSLTPASLTSS